MADFEQAIPIILKDEGGYSNNKSDKGGETYCGISRLDNPNWVGWKIIDGYKMAHPLHNGDIIKDTVLDGFVHAQYKAKYWDKIQGDNISSQRVANFLFDWFVNSGYHAVEHLQKCLDIRADGVMGSGTVAATNTHIIASISSMVSW